MKYKDFFPVIATKKIGREVEKLIMQVSDHGELNGMIAELNHTLL